MDENKQMNDRMDKIERKLEIITGTQDIIIGVLNSIQDNLAKISVYMRQDYKQKNNLKEKDRYGEIKEQVRLMTLAGVSINDQAKKLNVTARTVTNWKIKLKQEGLL